MKKKMKRVFLKILTAVFTCILIGFHPLKVFAVTYSFTDLGTLGGPGSYGYGINDSGQVTGYSSTASGYTHAFLYSGGVMTDLNDLLPSGPPSWMLYEAGGSTIWARSQAPAL